MVIFQRMDKNALLLQIQDNYAVVPEDEKQAILSCRAERYSNMPNNEEKNSLIAVTREVCQLDS